MIRVGGGSARGRRLRSPKGARPTLGRVKQSLFDMLAWRLEGSAFLDVFAGSGAVGIEALSRGAKRAVFVESHIRQVTLIKENLRQVGLSETAQVLRGDAAQVLTRLGNQGEEPFDIVFMDPPYADGTVLQKALDTFAAHMSLLAYDGILIVERAKRTLPVWPDAFVVTDSRTFGDTVLDIARKDESSRIQNPELSVWHSEQGLPLQFLDKSQCQERKAIPFSTDFL